MVQIQVAPVIRSTQLLLNIMILLRYETHSLLLYYKRSHIHN